VYSQTRPSASAWMIHTPRANWTVDIFLWQTISAIKFHSCCSHLSINYKVKINLVYLRKILETSIIFHSILNLQIITWTKQHHIETMHWSIDWRNITSKALMTILNNEKGYIGREATGQITFRHHLYCCTWRILIIGRRIRFYVFSGPLASTNKSFPVVNFGWLCKCKIECCDFNLDL